MSTSANESAGRQGAVVGGGSGRADRILPVAHDVARAGSYRHGRALRLRTGPPDRHCNRSPRRTASGRGRRQHVASEIESWGAFDQRRRQLGGRIYAEPMRLVSQLDGREEETENICAPASISLRWDYCRSIRSARSRKTLSRHRQNDGRTESPTELTQKRGLPVLSGNRTGRRRTRLRDGRERTGYANLGAQRVTSNLLVRLRNSFPGIAAVGPALL